jgi:hypothetical protein
MNARSRASRAKRTASAMASLLTSPRQSSPMASQVHASGDLVQRVGYTELSASADWFSPNSVLPVCGPGYPPRPSPPDKSQRVAWYNRSKGDKGGTDGRRDNHS